jgi:hypothetical protein
MTKQPSPRNSHALVSRYTPGEGRLAEVMFRVKS